VFAEPWLAALPASEARRLRGRVGEVTGYRLGARDPIVVFPATSRLKELKLFEVPGSRLEAVGSQGLAGPASTRE